MAQPDYTGQPRGCHFPARRNEAFRMVRRQGVSGTLEAFSHYYHIPAVLTLLVIAAESLGALGLIVGFATRFCAFGIFCDMIGAIYLVHWPNGFFMNWFGKQQGEGFEYHLLVIGMALALMISGGGSAVPGQVNSPEALLQADKSVRAAGGRPRGRLILPAALKRYSCGRP